MPTFHLRSLAALIGAALLVFSLSPVLAQTPPEQKKDEQPKPQGDPSKDGQKKIDEFAEASRSLQGPAGNPECVWLGRRVVNLLWRDDLDTAFRHLDLYDRFGCPGGHIQATFRCVVRQGAIDPKVPETLTARVHACWINPALPPQTQASQPTGTNPQ